MLRSIMKKTHIHNTLFLSLLLMSTIPAGGQILDQIPAGDVIKIEVITSLEAKYDAQGIGGIINLVTHKRIYFKSSGYTNMVLATKGSHLMGNYAYSFNGKRSISAQGETFTLNLYTLLLLYLLAWQPVFHQDNRRQCNRVTDNL